MDIKIRLTNNTVPTIYLPKKMYQDYGTKGKLTVDGMKLTVDCTKTLEQRIGLAVKTKDDLKQIYGDIFNLMSCSYSGVTVCTIKANTLYGIGKTLVGVAVCSPTDYWNDSIGEAIAMCRAIDVPVPLALVSF